MAAGPDHEEIAAAINRELPALGEKLDVPVMALAVEDELAGTHGRDEIASWTIEEEPFGVWLPGHLATLDRSRKAYTASQRRKLVDPSTPRYSKKFQAALDKAHREGTTRAGAEVTADPTDEEMREAFAWVNDIEVVGDGPDGPIYTLRDGTVVTIDARMN